MGQAAAAVDDRSADPMIGQTIDGRYIVESLLGEGGMGTVYAARHAIIDKRVAIKVLRKEAAADESSAQRFIIEAKAASKIGHQNIVDITDFGVLPAGNAYFVMEFLDGPTLGKLVHELKHIPPARAVAISIQVARGLAAAHEKSIIHRDLKPENIFVLEKDGIADFVKIVDFGIAKDVKAGKRLTAVGMVLGTPEYMSPEQATGQESDHRVDQYALGCIFYEMLTGDVPFKGENAPKTLTRHVFDAVVPPTKLLSRSRDPAARRRDRDAHAAEEAGRSLRRHARAHRGVRRGAGQDRERRGAGTPRRHRRRAPSDGGADRPRARSCRATRDPSTPPIAVFGRRGRGDPGGRRHAPADRARPRRRCRGPADDGGGRRAGARRRRDAGRAGRGGDASEGAPRAGDRRADPGEHAAGWRRGLPRRRARRRLAGRGPARARRPRRSWSWCAAPVTTRRSARSRSTAISRSSSCSRPRREKVAVRTHTRAGQELRRPRRSARRRRSIASAICGTRSNSASSHMRISRGGTDGEEGQCRRWVSPFWVRHRSITCYAKTLPPCGGASLGLRQ